MKLSKRILSVILTLAMLITAMPMVVGAEVGSVDYDLTLFSQDFNDLTDAKGITKIAYKSGTSYSITVSIADDPINGGTHGKVAKIAKTASETASGTDSYFRIDYTNDDTINATFADKTEVLTQVKASMDVYIPANFRNFNIRFYDRTSGSTKSDDFASVARVENDDETVSAKVEIASNNIILETDAWHTFVFYADCAAGTYYPVIDGKEYGVCDITDTNGNGNTIDTCISSFGITGTTSTAAHDIYVDNMKLEVPMGVLVPENTNTVWENDFDDVNGFDSYATCTGSAMQELDLEPLNCSHKITTEADGNKYYSFRSNGTTASTGNIFKSGYFTNTDIDKFPIDKLKLEFSINLAALMDTQICSYYFGTMNGSSNNAYQFLKFKKDGTISYNNTLKDVIIGSYKAGDWMDFVVNIDYTEKTVAIVKDGKLLHFATDFSETVDYFNQIRFRKASGSNNEAEVVSIDNLKYSTTYSNAYINRVTANQGIIAAYDFENETVGTEINGSTTDYEAYGLGNTSEDANASTYSAKIGGGSTNKYAIINAYNNANTPRNTRFGMADEYIRNSDVYKAFGKYPRNVRVQFDMYKVVAASAAYVEIGGADILMVGSNHYIRFNNNSSLQTASGYLGIATGAWVTYTIDIDTYTKKYKLYIDGQLASHNGTDTFDFKGSSVEKLRFSANAAADEKLWVDNISITALFDVQKDKFSEWYDADGTINYGYAVNNTANEEITYTIVCAKFNSADDTLAGIVSVDKTNTVVANQLELKELEVATPASGYYYQYFIWSDVDDTITPLTESMIIQ